MVQGAAIIGIDFGTEWIKVGIAKSRSPIDIVLNEQSKRKTAAMIGFRDDDRYFGDAAKALATRFPDLMFSNLKLVLGQPHTQDVLDLLQKWNLPFKVAENKERGGTIDLLLRDGTRYTPEELIAMIFRNIKKLSEIDSSQRVSECVITVPPSFNERQRQAIIDAAELAGFKVLALINEQTASAIHYALSKKFTEKQQFNALIVDIGAQGERASVVAITPPATAKEATSSLGKIEVLGSAWDNAIGGSEVDNRLARLFAEQFEKKHKKTVSENPVVMAKLKKEALKIKEVLSANQDTPVIVESLFDDIDFRSAITRKELEELCADVFAKVVAPIERALAIANLSKDKINALELIGGGVRIPAIQRVLKEYFGRDLSYSMNGDEAIALGSAFYAAKISPLFQVAKLELTDLYPYSADFTVTDNTGIHHLFLANEKTHSKKSITLPRTKDFSVILQSEQFSPSQDFAQFNLGGVETIFTNWEADASTLPEEQKPKDVKSKVKLSFRISDNGFIVLDSATAIREDVVNVAVKEAAKNATTATATATAANTTATADADAATTATATATATAEPVAPATTLKSEKRVQSANIKVNTTLLGLQPFTPSLIALAKQRMQQFDERDEAKNKLAKARNDIEAYIYDMKDKLSDERYDPYSTKELKIVLKEKVDFYDEWLNYGPGSSNSVTLEDFVRELEQLTSLGGPILYRYEQATLRPKAIETCRSALETTNALIRGLEKSMPWVTAAEREDAARACDEVEAWIRVKSAEQATKKEYEPPVFTDSDVERECANHALKYNVLKYKKKPPPPPKPTVDATATTATATDSNNTTTASNSTTGAKVTAEGATIGDDAATATEATTATEEATATEAATEEQKQASPPTKDEL